MTTRTRDHHPSHEVECAVSTPVGVYALDQSDARGKGTSQKSAQAPLKARLVDGDVSHLRKSATKGNCMMDTICRW